MCDSSGAAPRDAPRSSRAATVRRGVVDHLAQQFLPPQRRAGVAARHLGDEVGARFRRCRPSPRASPRCRRRPAASSATAWRAASSSPPLRMLARGAARTAACPRCAPDAATWRPHRTRRRRTAARAGCRDPRPRTSAPRRPIGHTSWPFEGSKCGRSLRGCTVSRPDIPSIITRRTSPRSRRRARCDARRPVERAPKRLGAHPFGARARLAGAATAEDQPHAPVRLLHRPRAAVDRRAPTAASAQRCTRAGSRPSSLRSSLNFPAALDALKAFDNLALKSLDRIVVGEWWLLRRHRACSLYFLRGGKRSFFFPFPPITIEPIVLASRSRVGGGRAPFWPAVHCPSPFWSSFLLMMLHIRCAMKKGAAPPELKTARHPWRAPEPLRAQGSSRWVARHAPESVGQAETPFSRRSR